MKFTIIKNLEGNLAKEIKSDGTTISSAHLVRGSYKEATIDNLEMFNDYLNKLERNEAIALGVTENPQGNIVSQDMLTHTKDIQKGHTISRTKEYFSFQNESILLLDIDTDNGENIECENYEDIIEILTKLDNQFTNAEILIRHSSSSHIYQWEKGDKKLFKGAGSYHVYVLAKNVNTDLDNYIKTLKDKAFELGYGYVKVSKSGSMLNRQVFDSSVFSPERLVFEVGMICESPYEQEQPEAFYQKGTFIDCKNTPRVDIDKVNTQVFNAIEKVQGKAEETRKTFFKNEEQKLVTLGYSQEEAKQKVEKLLSDKKLSAKYPIMLSDNVEISVKDVFLHPDKYNNISCYDPIEPEKGKGKAMIYANDGMTPIIHSFVHGGIIYKLEIDYSIIYTIAENSHYDLDNNQALVTRIKKLAAKANLSESGRKEIGIVLKSKKIIHSVNDLQLTIDEKKEQGKLKGFIDFTPSGICAPTVDNLKVLMKNKDIDSSYDVILKNTDIRHASINDNAPSKEEAILSLIEKYAYEEGIDPNITKHIPALANSNYSNPLMDYVKESHKEYEGGNHIGQLAKMFQTNDTTLFYIEEIMRKWFIQCIAVWDYDRTTPHQDAKEKFESVLVLQGKQGVQKTKFFSALLPKEKEHYIKTGAMLNPSDKDSLMQNTSYAIVELGELESTFNKSDIGALKAFLSNSLDEYRVPYGKTATKNKRCTSFCGSVNESGFLRDPTGARRFWVIPVKSIDFQAFENIDKDMLWAQAYELYINGEKWWFDSSDEEVNTELERLHNHHKAYSSADDLFHKLAEFNTSEQWMSVSSIFELWGNKNGTKKDINDLATILDSAGYERNSRKEFCIHTKYKELPVQSSPSSSSIIDFFDESDLVA